MCLFMLLHKISVKLLILNVFLWYSICINGQEDYLIGSRLFVSPGTINLINIENDQISSLGSINGITGYIGGDCTFDKNNNRYFINTAEGIKVINAINGSVISSIPNQESGGFLITSIEYNPNNDRLIG